METGWPCSASHSPNATSARRILSTSRSRSASVIAFVQSSSVRYRRNVSDGSSGHAKSGLASHGIEVLNAFRHQRMIDRGVRSFIAAGSGAQRLSASTDYRPILRNLAVVVRTVLNAFRHQRIIDAFITPPRGVPAGAQRLSASTDYRPKVTSCSHVSRVCSTPFGINGLSTKRRPSGSVRKRCAQRLSASTDYRPRSRRLTGPRPKCAQRLSASTDYRLQPPRIGLERATRRSAALTREYGIEDSATITIEEGTSPRRTCGSQ